MTIFTREQAKTADRELYNAMLVAAAKTARVESALDHIHHVAGDSYNHRYNSRSGWKMSEAEATTAAADLAATDQTYKGKEAQRALDKLTAAEAELAQARADKKAADKWADHGRWNRYAVVPGGHIHTNEGCFTLRFDTDVRWAYEVSGDSVADAIDTYGEALCSHCYPDAPVAQTLGKIATDPNGNPITKAEAQAAKDAKAAEKAAKEAAKNAAAVIDVVTGKVIFKTDRAATNAVASDLSDAIWYGPGHPSYGEWIATLDQVSAALGAKQGRDAAVVRAELVAKAEKKSKGGILGDDNGGQ
jgi:hypothetical protein